MEHPSPIHVLSKIDEEETDQDNTIKKVQNNDYVDRFERDPSFNPFTATQDKNQEESRENPFQQTYSYNESIDSSLVDISNTIAPKIAGRNSSQMSWSGVASSSIGDGLDA